MIITKKQPFSSIFKLLNFLLIFIIVISLSACDLISGDGGNKCKETEQPEFEKSLSPAIYIKNKSGDSYWGAHVEINIYKEYCDGTIKGTFIKKATTLENGYANFAYVFTYKFANLEDKVNYTITVTGEDPLTGDTKKYKFSDSIGYEKASGYAVDPIFLNHTLQVTW